MEQRIIKFRTWFVLLNKMVYFGNLVRVDTENLMQFTGLTDKNGKEIYELMEINNKYRIIYQAPKYVLQDISSGDIMDLYEQNKLEITGEYSPF